MNESLFRQEALVACLGSRFGKAVFYQPLPLRLLVTGTAVMFLALVAFAAWAEIKETRPVRGVLTASAGETKVYSDRPGRLTTVTVEEGDHVAAGTILAILQDPRFSATGVESAALLQAHIAEQTKQLREQLHLAGESAGMRRNQLEARKRSLAQELNLLQEEHAFTVKRLELARNDLDAATILHQRGSLAKVEYNRQLTTLYSLQQMRVSNQLSIAGTEQELREVQQQLDLHPVSSRDEQLRLEAALTQLQARATELTTSASFTLVAPVSGTVSNLMVRVGDTADPRSPVLILMPDQGALSAEMYLPSAAVGKIAPGQSIMLNYDAYPYESYGSFAATVDRISATTIDPREVLIPLPLQEPVYRLQGTLELQQPEDLTLRPGMQFSAEIITGRRSILDRLLQPLQSLGRRL